MSKDKKKIHVEFAPGAFDSWEGTQEELDEFVTEIQRMADAGTLEGNSVAIDDDDAWALLTEEEKAIINQSLESLEKPPTRH